MTKDKNIIENFEFLDSILKFLIDDCIAYESTFDNLYFHLYNRVLSEDKKQHFLKYYSNITVFDFTDIEKNIESFISDNTLAEGEKLVEACYYLSKHEYVRLNHNFNIRVTFEGIVKHSNGFVFSYKKEIFENNYATSLNEFQRKSQNRMLWINGAIAVGTLMAMLYYLLEMISTSYCFCK